MDDMREGEVLWIDSRQYPELVADPDGFPFKVFRFAGLDPDSGKVWVRGIVLDRRTGAARRDLTLLVPLNQPRARYQVRATPPQTPVGYRRVA